MLTITDVHQQPSGLWIVTDDTGQQYATKSALLAATAERARATAQVVSILSFRGWYYRELRDITYVTAKEHCA